MEKRKCNPMKLAVCTMGLITTLTFQQYDVSAKDGETNVINEDYANRLSLQPVAPAFSVDSLLKWDPKDDPDAALNKASVPLNKNRFKGHQINPLANPKAGITSAAITLADHDRSSSVGSDSFDVYAFDNWQLLDSYIYWPGSENEEGIFAFPSPDIVDAAHRNGVPVYASIGFPWGQGSPETLKEIEDFTKKAKDGSFPVADKMIEAAEYYGFDGYFFNQETSGVSQETAERMNEMMRYAKRKSDIRFSWYDAQANDGSISYQNAVNEKNDMYVKPAKDGTYAVDEMFLNYDWGVSQIDKTVETMQKHHRDPYDAYAGFELQQNSYHTQVNTKPLLDENKQSKVSIALYTPNSTMGLAKDPADFHEQEKKLWTGPQGDPSKADDSKDWKGMARFVTDSSVIKTKPFVTNFNSGHGKQYFVNGKQANPDEWNNRSVQDIMPTWRWWTRGHGSKLQVSYDFNLAYNGGNSLSFSGDLDAGSENETMLYSTKLPVQDKTKVRIVYQGKQGADLSLGVSYSKDYAKKEMTYYPLPKPEKGWQTATIDLGKDAGKTAYALSLKVENSDAVADYQLNLGQIAVFEDKASEKIVPNDAKIEEKMLRSATEAEARLSWEAQEEAQFYEVYQKNAPGDLKLLGITPNHYFYANKITRTKENAARDNKTTIQIVPINKKYDRGEPAKVDFDWGIDIDATEVDQDPPSSNVALHANITDVSFENSAEPASKALDGSSSTKWAATNKDKGYLAIDLGKAKTIRRWRVEHAESGGETKDMNTVDFELLYKDKNGDWVSAKRIRDNHDAVTDVVLDKPVTAREFKLQVHNSGSSPWGAIRIYEWQMFESDVLPKTENIMMHFVSAENNPGAQDKVTLENVKKGQIVRLYASLNSKQAIAKKEANKDGTMIFDNLDLGPESGRIYYTVQSEGLKESLRFSTGYLGEKPAMKDLKTLVELLGEKGEIADEITIHALKMHVASVTHFADEGELDKVIKQLENFHVLLKHKKREGLISEKAFQSLTQLTEKLVLQYEADLQ